MWWFSLIIGNVSNGLNKYKKDSHFLLLKLYLYLLKNKSLWVKVHAEFMQITNKPTNFLFLHKKLL